MKRRSPSLAASAARKRAAPSKVERKLKDYLEVKGRYLGWPPAEYNQILGSFIFPVIWRDAKVALDITKSIYALTFSPRNEAMDEKRELAAWEAGFSRFAITDASIWSSGPELALGEVHEFLEAHGFIGRINPTPALKDLLYHKAIQAAAGASKRRAKVVRIITERTRRRK